jgi:hypothetical protein
MSDNHQRAAYTALRRQHRVLLRVCAIALRRIADASGNAQDRRAAEIAEDLAAEEDEKLSQVQCYA